MRIVFTIEFQRAGATQPASTPPQQTAVPPAPSCNLPSPTSTEEIKGGSYFCPGGTGHHFWSGYA